MKINKILKGTCILSAIGILTRLMGFYYRIFLSRTIGANGLGLYQMIFPVYGLGYSFAVSGIQMSISRFTAVKVSKNDNVGMHNVLRLGTVFSLSLSLLAAFFLYFFSHPIAAYILKNARLELLLKYISLALPFSSIHSCISSYYIGQKKVSVSAISQITEQIMRIFSVYIISTIAIIKGYAPSPVIAVAGIIIGEFFADLVCFCFVFSDKIFTIKKLINKFQDKSPVKKITTDFKEMISMAYPITLDRIIGSLLSSTEAMLIPFSLIKYGMTSDEAISTYGIFSGMALPLILFPSTIIGSLSQMILPDVAASYASGNLSRVERISKKLTSICVAVGICCSVFFYFSGEIIGKYIFSNSDAGLFISILAWLCPFLYIASTSAGILNGMGHTKTTFLINTFSSSLRIVFIYLIIPTYGMKGFLTGILASYVLSAILLKSSVIRQFS